MVSPWWVMGHRPYGRRALPTSAELPYFQPAQERYDRLQERVLGRDRGQRVDVVVRLVTVDEPEPHVRAPRQCACALEDASGAERRLDRVDRHLEVVAVRR